MDVKNAAAVRFVHVCSRVERPAVSLTRHAVACWLWKRLRRSFPDALAAVLMPEHMHVLARAATEADARLRMASVVSALVRSNNAGARNVFAPASARGAFAEPQKIARQVRYIVLNPCRAGYVRCPLEWVWTTHRDVVGAVIDPWVSPERIRTLPGQPPRQHHRYVAADPSTRVDGTPYPQHHDGHPQAYSVQQARRASIAAARGDRADITRSGEPRRQFLALAKLADWRARTLGMCQLNVKTLHNYLRRSAPVHDAVRVCLADARLTAYLQRDEARNPSYAPWMECDGSILEA